MRGKLKFIVMFVLLTMVAGAGSLHAQHYIGIRGGYGGSSARFYPPQDMGTVWGLYSGGISWKFYTSEAWVGGTEIDILFIQQGFRRYDKNIMQDYLPAGAPYDATGYFQRTVNSIMVPIFWQPHMYLFKQRVRFFLNLGVTFSYNMDSRQKVASKVNGTVMEGKYQMMTTRDNRFGYGLCGGGGFSWILGRMEIFAEGRYYIGYGDILKNASIYESNPRRSPMDGLKISVGAYWRLGKGGIRSQQGMPPTEEMIREMELRRQERIDEIPEEFRVKKHLPEKEKPAATSDASSTEDGTTRAATDDSETSAALPTEGLNSIDTEDSGDTELLTPQGGENNIPEIPTPPVSQDLSPDDTEIGEGDISDGQTPVQEP